MLMSAYFVCHFLFGFIVSTRFLFSGNAEEQFAAQRVRMVEDQIKDRGVRDERVLAALRKIPRHDYLPERLRSLAYADQPLPIGLNQTISQPYIVAYMTAQLGLKGNEKILEVGTGSGYQAAVLAEIVKEVYSIEILCPLAQRADSVLKTAGYKNIRVQCGDGYRGWPAAAPFDGIIVTAAPDHIPQPLIDQLKTGGRMILPLGENGQELVLVIKTASGIEKQILIPVRFVPMTGKALEK